MHDIAAASVSTPVVPVTQAFMTTPGTLEVSLAREVSDQLAAYQLLYAAYLRAGLCADNALQMRVTPFHALATTEVFVVKCGGQVISTLTMVADGHMGLPMETMYAEEANELRDLGHRLAEIGCLADRRSEPARFVNVFGELARLVCQVAEARGIDALVIAVHPRHARYYQRALGFRPFAPIKNCPYVQSNPAIALMLDFKRVRESKFAPYLFGEPFASEQLEPTRWDPQAMAYLDQLTSSISGSSQRESDASMNCSGSEPLIRPSQAAREASNRSPDDANSCSDAK